MILKGIGVERRRQAIERKVFFVWFGIKAACLSIHNAEYKAEVTRTDFVSCRHRIKEIFYIARLKGGSFLRVTWEFLHNCILCDRISLVDTIKSLMYQRLRKSRGVVPPDTIENVGILPSTHSFPLLLFPLSGKYK